MEPKEYIIGYNVPLLRCGIRGGYMELMGMDSKFMEQLYKLCSARLCSTTLGQVCGYCKYIGIWWRSVLD